MRVRLRPTCLAAVAAGALLAAPSAASASALSASGTAASAPSASALAPPASAAFVGASTAAASGALLRGPASFSVIPAIRAPLRRQLSAEALPATDQRVSVRRSQSGRGNQQLPGPGYDGMVVAAIGTGLTLGGWLLILAGGRRLRRRTGRRS